MAAQPAAAAAGVVAIGQLALHDRGELGRKMLARIAKHRGLKPEDLKATSAKT
jgi:hypothetical protein